MRGRIAKRQGRACEAIGVKAMTWENRHETIAARAWETWTRNGKNMDEHDLYQTRRHANDAANNAYLENMTNKEWLNATLRALGAFPSQESRADFLDWLRFILKSPEGAEKWAAYLIESHDWSASDRIEISGRQTKSGNPEIYTFEQESAP